MDVVALGELLIDFACLNMDQDGYPTMAAIPRRTLQLFSSAEQVRSKDRLSG